MITAEQARLNNAAYEQRENERKDAIAKELVEKITEEIDGVSARGSKEHFIAVSRVNSVYMRVQKLMEELGFSMKHESGGQSVRITWAEQ